MAEAPTSPSGVPTLAGPGLDEMAAAPTVQNMLQPAVQQQISLSDFTAINEAKQWWDISIAIPIKKVSELQLNSVSNTVAPATINRQNSFAVADLFPLKRDLVGVAPSLVPHPLLGVSLASQPLHTVLAGLGAGFSYGDFYIGAILQKSQNVTGLAAGSTATPAQLAAATSYSYKPQFSVGWCWAAVASSVDAYYKAADPNDVMTQCQAAQTCLTAQTPICAVDCRNPACNQVYYLEAALRAANHLEADPFEYYPTFPSIVAVIMESRTPIGVRLGAGSPGHFVLIVGVDDDNGAQDLFVADPLYSPGQFSYRIGYDDFCKSPDGTIWTHTYPIK